jgi:hypothetical protein
MSMSEPTGFVLSSRNSSGGPVISEQKTMEPALAMSGGGAIEPAPTAVPAASRVAESAATVRLSLAWRP